MLIIQEKAEQREGTQLAEHNLKPALFRGSSESRYEIYQEWSSISLLEDKSGEILEMQGLSILNLTVVPV